MLSEHDHLLWALVTKIHSSRAKQACNLAAEWRLLTAGPGIQRRLPLTRPPHRHQQPRETNNGQPTGEAQCICGVNHSARLDAPPRSFLGKLPLWRWAAGSCIRLQGRTEVSHPEPRLVSRLINTDNTQRCTCSYHKDPQRVTVSVCALFVCLWIIWMHVCWLCMYVLDLQQLVD